MLAMSPTRLAIGIAAFVALIRIPTLPEPRWYYDETVFTAVAWVASKGIPLYAGAYDLHPPGIYWLFQGLLAPGARDHHIVVQLAATAFVIATAVLTFEIARRSLPLWAAALAGITTGFVLSLPTMDGDLMNVELAGLPFFLAAVLLSFSGRYAALFVAGALAGIALVMRPSFLVDGIALLVPLLAAKPRVLRVMLVGLGTAASLGLAILVLSLGGALDAHFSIVVPSDHEYLLQANRGTLDPMFVRLVVLGVVAAISLRIAKSEFGRLLAIWVPASIAGSSLTPLAYTHLVHEAIPPMAITIALVAARFGQGHRVWATAGAAVALLVASELVLILPAWQAAAMTGTDAPRFVRHNYAFYEMPAYYANWALYVTGMEGWSEYQAFFVDVKRQDEEMALLRTLAGSKDLRLQVLGGRPGLYVDSGLLPASRYVVTRSAYMPRAAVDVHRDISTGCADLVVDVSSQDTYRSDLDSGGYVEVPNAPWPTFRATRPHGPCINT